MHQNFDQAIKTLNSQRLLLYPTDTVWGIGCDATNYDAVSKIYKLKRREDSKALVCLVSDIEMLKTHVNSIPENALEVLRSSTTPTTIIYNNPIGFASNLLAADNTIAIRIPQDAFCVELIQRFKKPIVSTSANISGEPTPNSFKEISKHILKGVDYIVNLQEEKNNAKPSSIIKINTNGSITVIRA